MKRNWLVLAIVLLIWFIVNSCGDDDEQPQPTQQTYPIDLGNGKIVNINYMAVTGAAMPTYMADLVTVLENIAVAMPAGTYTINVIVGNTGFTKTGSKTLSVGTSWFIGKGENDIGVALVGVLDSWIAQVKNQNRIRYAGGMSPFELV